MENTRPTPGRACRRLAVCTVLAAVTLSGCGGDDSGGSSRDADTQRVPDPNDLEGRTFDVIEVTGRELAAGTTVTLAFVDGSVIASGGCNSGRGAFDIADGRLEVDGMAQTMMACDEPAMDQDTWVNEFLTAAPAIALDGANLTLTGDDLTMTLAEAPPSSP